jgi:CBS domain-containing protein
MVHITVAQIFHRKGRRNITISPDATVLDALRLMAEKNIGSIIVMDGDEYCGLLTERDYARKIMLLGKSSTDTLVAEIMLEYLPKISLRHKLEECMGIMSAHNIRYLPVFEGDEFYGVISVMDVVKEALLSQQETINQLQNYIHSTV